MTNTIFSDMRVVLAALETRGRFDGNTGEWAAYDRLMSTLMHAAPVPASAQFEPLLEAFNDAGFAEKFGKACALVAQPPAAPEDEGDDR